ncbi:LPXTG cell wall anchor domain-containing protein [Nakamurella sp. PAMC28650]|nr:LPXTG cell wall anchor domain-containing protein [Nakamurella sp. PAMC28650]
MQVDAVSFSQPVAVVAAAQAAAPMAAATPVATAVLSTAPLAYTGSPITTLLFLALALMLIGGLGLTLVRRRTPTVR